MREHMPRTPRKGVSDARHRARHELLALLAAAWAWSSPVIAEEVAAAAAPRQGNGDSALIEAASPPAQPPGADQPGTLRADRTPWTVPPLRWGGYVGLDLRQFTAEGQPRRTQVIELANLTASSYIWEPWFAQV